MRQILCDISLWLEGPRGLERVQTVMFVVFLILLACFGWRPPMHHGPGLLTRRPTAASSTPAARDNRSVKPSHHPLSNRSFGTTR